MRASILLVCVLWASFLPAASYRDETPAIKHVIFAYNKAINKSDVAGITALFSTDGVFMPSGLPTVVGIHNIKIAYQHEFAKIGLDVKTKIDEITFAGDIAYVRSRSIGELTLLSSGKKKSTEHYRAFFVLRKIDSQWKIARFMYNFSA